MSEKIDHLTKKMELARGRLDATMQKIAPQDDIYPSWKLKQLMDHITGWDELLASSFRTHSRGDPPIILEDRGIDRYNEESILARKGLSLESSRKPYDEARHEVLEVLHAMPLEKLNQKFLSPWGDLCSIASVLKIFISHEIDHTDDLEERLNMAGNTDN